MQAESSCESKISEKLMKMIENKDDKPMRWGRTGIFS